ncbi:MAG: RagB/SusD family nutrient uptake outer membrane protein [Paludibacteraceae bacterium]|nr:RagB/SusD family nutrient uptake outer membrane protein [Paludibacteraceae bacterium]
MKKSIIYTLIISLGLSLTSCKDFLEEKAYGSPTSEELLQDPENMVRLVGQAYAELKWLHDHWGYWGLNTLTSDEARCPVRNPGNNWDDSGYWLKLNSMEWDQTGQSFENVWDRCIAGANLCNKILKQISAYEDKVKASDYKRYTAELAVLRSYYYFTMFDLFGRIPYTEEFPSSETAQFPLLPVQDVWTNLVNCLEKETPNLPAVTPATKAENYGRASQALGYGLLARLYLNADSYGIKNLPANAYTKCAEYCQKIIDSKGYSLESNFFNNFIVHNENSSENIFVIVENGNAAFDYQDVAGTMCNKLRINLLTQHYSFQTIYGLLEKPWNGFAASSDYLSMFEASDRRGPCPENAGTDINFQDVNKKFCWFLGPVKDANGNIMTDDQGDQVIIVKNFKSKENSTWNDGARCMKYETELNSTVNKYSENDFVLMRYAEIVLMYAEACLRGAEGYNLGYVQSDLDLIRTRAGVMTLTSLNLNTDRADKNSILNERAREFAWENLRRRDLIRFGVYTNPSYKWDFKNIKPGEDFRKWFPIPKKMIEVHAGDIEPWEQNEGYK